MCNGIHVGNVVNNPFFTFHVGKQSRHSAHLGTLFWVGQNRCGGDIFNRANVSGRSFWQRCNRMEVWDLVTERYSLDPCSVYHRDVHANLVLSK